jgi:hypothetical protein
VVELVPVNFMACPFAKLMFILKASFEKASTLHILPLRHNLQKDKPNCCSASDHGKAYSLVDSPASVDETGHPVVNNDVDLMMWLWEEYRRPLMIPDLINSHTSKKKNKYSSKGCFQSILSRLLRKIVSDQHTYSS